MDTGEAKATTACKTKQSESDMKSSYTKVVIDGEEDKTRFKCNLCDYESEKERGMSNHYGKMHKAKAEKRRRSNEVENSAVKKKKDDNGESDDFDESIAAETFVDKGDAITDSQAENICEKFIFDCDGDENKEERNENKENEERREENEELRAKVASLEEAMVEKDEMMEICTAKKDSLEKDMIDKQAQIDRYRRVIVGMDKVIKSKGENRAGTSEDKAKVKKMNEEAKEREKKMETMGKRLDEMTRKVGEEANMRAKAEAEVLRSQKTIENLLRIVEKEKSGSPRRRERESRSRAGSPERAECRDLSKPDGCRFGAKCKFYHPAGKGMVVERQQNQDCMHWVEGHCNFADRCKYKHIPEKKGSKQGGQKQTNERQQGFAEALAMVREAVAGGSQQQQTFTHMGQQQRPMVQQQQQQQQPILMITQPVYGQQQGWGQGPAQRH